ncbi:MAG: asparagine synthase (glutamine-hydrolyzing) [Rubripirellula sp.]|nr:asparagine synthase (glutamine-hydrolyzing) [Rubripirellula sp.]
MCGITGAVWLDPNRALPPDLITKMTDTLAHRGPDLSSTWRCDEHRDARGQYLGAALGFRRLSIIDLEGAKQPLANENEDIHLVFNGEIYNYSTLRKRLQGSGHRFRTAGDGETILHLYEDLQEKCFEHLNGMFSIAIWDGRRHRLLLARDRIGQKPLYYSLQNNRFVFGSELKSLAQVDGICEKINPSAIDNYLTYQYIPHPLTIWSDVYKLPPGHFLIFENGKVTVRKYWDLDLQKQANIKPRDAEERVKEIFTDSVKLRLQSDVPLGSFLSGGIDSSLVTAIAQEQSASPIRTFSIGFPISDFDETAYAAKVAKYLGTQHQRFEVTPNGVEILEQLVWHYDEPFGDSSAVPTWYLSKLTRGEVTVALSGDGGDELFAGYERYRALWLSEKLQKLIPVHRVPGIGLIRKIPDSEKRRSLTRRIKRFIEAFGQNTPRRYLNWLQIFPEQLRASLYNADFLSTLPDEDPFEFLEKNWMMSQGRDVVTQAANTDLLTYLPCDLCTKVDIASMAHGLEVRQPFLDYRLVELAASLPIEQKFRGQRGKLLLQQCFKDKIPNEIFTRPKMGFGIPIAAWFRDELKELVRETLLSENAKSNQFFQTEKVAALCQAHWNKEQNHGYRLWNLLILEMWLRKWTQ